MRTTLIEKCIRCGNRFAVPSLTSSRILCDACRPFEAARADCPQCGMPKRPAGYAPRGRPPVLCPECAADRELASTREHIRRYGHGNVESAQRKAGIDAAIFPESEDGFEQYGTFRLGERIRRQAGIHG